MNTGIADAMENARNKAALDRHVKCLFGHKAVLTVLLKYCVPEFKDVDERVIMEECFVGEPIIGKTPVERDAAAEDASDFPPQSEGIDLDALMDGSERATLLNGEDVTQTEGTAIYDIVFQARAPGSDDVISLLINVEIQRDAGLSYKVVTRGIYYCGRLLSAQRNRIFRKQEYHRLQKVYSIWICPYSATGRNTITTYDVRETAVEGDGSVDRRAYDKLETVVITLNADAVDNANRLIRFLGLLIHRDMPVDDRKRLIEDEYRIAMTEDIVEEVRDMCNYSDAIEKIGEAKGEARGMVRGEARLRKLLTLLYRLNRTEDAVRAATDEAYCAKLYREFGIA